jgi:Trypsin-like peptidase domain
MTNGPKSTIYPKLALGALAVAGFAILASPAMAQSSRAAEAQPQVATEGMTHEEYARAQEDLNRWLYSEMPSAALGRPVSARFDPSELQAIDRAPRSVSPLRIGLVKALAPGVELAGIGRGPHKGIGASSPTPDGGLVWSLVIAADGVGAIRLHVQGMSLPNHAALYVFSRGGEAFGPYVGDGPNGTGEFWTTALFGSEAILQLRISGAADEADLRAVALRVTDVGVITENFAAGLGVASEARPDPVPAPQAFCGNANCLVDATCFNVAAANPAKSAVAKMEWIKGAFIYTCTGGLISDNNPSQSNYFITANHCFNKTNTAQSVDFYWRFATSTCNGACPSNNGWPFKTTGSSVRATGRKGDFTLGQLNGNPPSGSVFLGWTNAPVANTNGAQLYRISNPDFGPQVYSQHNVSTTAGTCSGWPRGERIYSKDITGAIDGGSSGSPVVNGSSQIVGQLSGTCGTNVNDPCDAAANATVDGALAFYYASVQPFINP